MTAAEPVVVGISTHAVRARWGVWDTDVALIQDTYPAAVAAAGGVPVLLPAVPGAVAAVLPRLDALVLAGGPDIDPARYGQDPHERAVLAAARRDEAELELLAAALELGLPLLGVCRGMQLLNVARGGTLLQHLPDVVGHAAHAPTPGTFGTHPVRVHPHSRLAQVLGRQDVTGVPTYHHQAIDELGDGLVATAWTHDGTVEALEDPSLPFCLGVQWHPEAGDDPALFVGLVDAARELREHAAPGAARRVARSSGGRRAAAAAVDAARVPPTRATGGRSVVHHAAVDVHVDLTDARLSAARRG